MFAAFFACVIGLYVIVAAAGNWNWYFEHPNARYFVARFGRRGARVFYLALGASLILLAGICQILA
jgi:predicted small integral membrane protein